MLVRHSNFVPEGPQPMEVAPAEPAKTVVAQLPSRRFTWTIENFSRLNTRKLYSDVFCAGGFKWRVLMFPKGNNVDHLSLYLDVADSTTLPYCWSRYAQFSFAVVNQIHNELTLRKDTQHQFHARESDWGFTSFMPLSQLYDPSRGYLLNDTCIIEADVAVRTHVNNEPRDSEKVVRFRSLEKPKEDEFSLELSKLHNYDDVVERVAHLLGLDDPSKIRLTSHNCYSQQPKPQPIKYRGVEHLSDMLVHNNQTSDILYYEVLDIPLPELQGLMILKVAFHHTTEDKVEIHTIRLSKQSKVGDVISDLKTKVKLSYPNAEVRLLEIFQHKIYKIFTLDEKIENVIDQYWTLRAEEIPEEEKEIGPQDILIHVYHFMKDSAQNQVQNFGDPFFLVIRESETLAEVKVRVQKKLQVPDEDFSKWKFAFLSLGQPEYLHETDILSTHFQKKDVYGAWEQYLGLEHSDNAPKRSYAASANTEGHNTELALGQASMDTEGHNTELAFKHEAQVIEASAHTESHNTELAPGHGTAAVEKKGIACISMSSGLKIINLEDAAPPVVDDPESWRGFPVGKDHACLLHETELQHPDFFNDVKYSSARRAIQSLNLLASNLANLASDKSEHLSRDDLRVMRDELSDLERDGFRIRWVVESVDHVLTLRFQLPLQQEIAQLIAESTHLRGEIENLQQKTASLEDEVTTLKEKIDHKEEELAVAKKDMGQAELRLKDIASELETRGRLLAEYTSILH